MYTVLVIVGGFIGLIVTGAAFYTVWLSMEARKKRVTIGQESQEAKQDVLFAWTVMDYAAIGVFVIGMMLIVADLLAITRDRDSYPFYHYGYLWCSFIFMLVGMIFMVVRLGVLLRSDYNNKGTTRSASQVEPALPNESPQPDKTDKTDKWV
jgi:magnesium-transporting ATPase (P-type)